MSTDAIVRMGHDVPVAVIRAIEQMREHLDEPLHLSDHAHAGLYSPHHFHRMFRFATGITPARFLAAERMARAKSLLASSSLLIRSIQTEVGYNSLSTFTSQFTKLVGVSPGSFRRLVDTAAELPLTDLDVPERINDGPNHLVAVADSSTEGFCAAGLFEASLPEGRPAGFAFLRGKSAAILDGEPASGTYSIFTVALDHDAKLVDFALCPRSQIRVGRSQVRIGGGSVAGAYSLVPMRRVRVADPPVVSAIAAVHLLQSAVGGRRPAPARRPYRA